MARLSQQLLSNLGNPTGMLAGAAQLGQALGSAPGLIAERNKKRETLARTSEISQLLTQGIEYANTGNQEEYNSVVAGLQNKVETATDPEEQRIAQQALNTLNQQRRVLDTNVEKGQTREGIGLLAAIEAGGEDSAEALAKFNGLSITAQDNARAFQNNLDRHEQNKEREAREDFIDSVQPGILAAVRDNNPDALAAIEEQAASVGATAAVHALINSQRNHYDRNKKIAQDLKLDSEGPITAVLEQQFSDLLDTYPEGTREEVRKSLNGGLEAYKAFAEKNWNKAQGIWNTGARAGAERLAEKINNRMDGLHYRNVSDRINRVTALISKSERDVIKLGTDIGLVNSSNPRFQREAVNSLAINFTTEQLKKHKEAGTYGALVNERATIHANTARNILLINQQESKAQLYEARKELEDGGPKDDTRSMYTFGEKVEEEIAKAMAENGDMSETDIVVQFIRTGQVSVDGDNVITFTGRGKSVTEQLDETVKEAGRNGYTLTGYGSSMEDYKEEQQRKYPLNKNVSTTGY